MNKDRTENNETTAQASIEEAIGMIVGSEPTRGEGAAAEMAYSRADNAADGRNAADERRKESRNTAEK